MLPQISTHTTSPFICKCLRTHATLMNFLSCSLMFLHVKWQVTFIGENLATDGTLKRVEIAMFFHVKRNMTFLFEFLAADLRKNRKRKFNYIHNTLLTQKNFNIINSAVIYIPNRRGILITRAEVSSKGLRGS